jgi:hypothetical protein
LAEFSVSHSIAVHSQFIPPNVIIYQHQGLALEHIVVALFNPTNAGCSLSGTSILTGNKITNEEPSDEL